MKNLKQMLGIFLLCSLFVVLGGGEAYADDVLQAVRDKAANFLFRLRPVIFVLAAFGLVGFAWMAIFNKISWKWFANIAMGLFLVANMGLFIDYFATKSGRKGQYAEKLGYGSYLDTGYTATNGVGGDPQSQDVPGGDGTGTGDENGGGSSPNSSSDNFTGHSCTPGLVCGAEASGGSSDDVANASGSSEDGSSDNGGDNPSAGDGDSGSSAGGTSSGQQKQDSNTATKGATADSGSFSNNSSSQDNASANVSGQQASGAAEAYKALAGGDSVSGGDSSGDGASGDETASAQDAEPVGEEAKEKTEKEQSYEKDKSAIDTATGNSKTSSDDAANASSSFEDGSGSGGDNHSIGENVNINNDSENSASTESDVSLSQDNGSDVNCDVLKNKCSNDAELALMKCEDIKDETPLSYSKWVRQVNGGKCLDQRRATREGEGITKSVKDKKDYENYLQSMQAELKKCQEDRKKLYLDPSECKFDQQPSESTYCDRYPDRCAVEQASTVNMCRDLYNEYANPIKNRKENCRNEAFKAADECLAPCL